MPGVLTTAPTRRRAPVSPLALVAFVALGLGLGAAGGAVWEVLVDLPVYNVGEGGRAGTSERGLAGFIAADAWFCVVGAVVGLLLGVLAWLRLSRLGWPVVLLTTLTALAAALVCWWVGEQVGPGDFNNRLAAARPGDRVPIDLTLRAPASLLVWPFFAVIPVLLGSSLGRDDEDPAPAPDQAGRDSG